MIFGWFFAWLSLAWLQFRNMSTTVALVNPGEFLGRLGDFVKNLAGAKIFELCATDSESRVFKTQDPESRVLKTLDSETQSLCCKNQISWKFREVKKNQARVILCGAAGQNGGP